MGWTLDIEFVPKAIKLWKYCSIFQHYASLSWDVYCFSPKHQSTTTTIPVKNLITISMDGDQTWTYCFTGQHCCVAIKGSLCRKANSLPCQYKSWLAYYYNMDCFHLLPLWLCKSDEKYQGCSASITFSLLSLLKLSSLKNKNINFIFLKNMHLSDFQK